MLVAITLVQVLLSELLFHKPADPKQYILDYLEKIKVTGTKPLLNQQDLATMFGMFDITNNGTVTKQQANNALRTVLGPQAAVNTPSGAERHFNKEEFVSYMKEQLANSTHYSQNS